MEKPQTAEPDAGSACQHSAETDQGRSVASSPDKRSLHFSLFEAVTEKNIDKVKELVRKGCKINKGWKFKKDKWTMHTTALVMAVSHGADELVEFLIKAGADVDKVSCNYSKNVQQSKTALSVACERREMNIMRILVEGGAHVNQIKRTEKLREEEGGLISYDDPENRLLHCSANRGDYVVCKQLLELGADPLITNKRKETPLHIACDHFYVDIIKLLLQSGGMTYQMDYERNSQMWRLIHYYHTDDELRELCTMFVMAGYDAALDDAVTRMWVSATGEFPFAGYIAKFIFKTGVMSLKELTRLQIRSQLGRLKLQVKIDSIEEVPKQLRDYLALRIL